MGTLKERIHREVHLFEPKSIEHAFNVERKVEFKKNVTRRVFTNSYRDPHVPPPNVTQPTKLTPQQMD